MWEYIQTHLTDVIQTIGIIVTLAIAIWQTWVQTKHTRAANELALLEKFDDLNHIWLEYPGLWDLLDTDYPSKTKDESYDRLSTVVFMVFNTFELAYRHHKVYGLLRRDDWDDWVPSLDIYLKKKYVEGWWIENGSELGERFRNFVNGRKHA